MKMIFPIKHAKHSLLDSSFFKMLIIPLLVLLLILGLSIFSTTRSWVSNLFAPFLKSGDYFYKTTSQIPNFFSDKNELIKKNENLLNEIEKNRLSLINYEALRFENQRLREDLKLKPIGDFISASIIARSPQIPLDSLFLDKGTLEGLNNGDLVLVGERILIGKLVKVSKNRSTVALNSFVGAISYGFVARTLEPIEIIGIGGGNIETKVPFDFDILVGDKIMVPGSVHSLVAVVGAIEEDRSSGFKNVLLSLPINISKINTVFVERVITE